MTLQTDDETGWITAQCIELPGAISEGRTRKSALRNVREAIQAVIEARAKMLRERVMSAEFVEVEVPEATYPLVA